MIDLRDTLDAAGVQGLRETKKEIVGRCPGHVARTGKEDHRPSWSVNKATYLHFCFSCGYKGTLTQLLVDLTGCGAGRSGGRAAQAVLPLPHRRPRGTRRDARPGHLRVGDHQPLGGRASPAARAALAGPKRHRPIPGALESRYQTVGAADLELLEEISSAPSTASRGRSSPSRPGWRRAARCSATTR